MGLFFQPQINRQFVFERIFFLSTNVCKDFELCYDHNCMHKYTFQEQYYLEIWIYQTNEKEKNQEQFFCRIMTTTNTFLLLKALVNGSKGTKKYFL
jgi:hypothetical protein